MECRRLIGCREFRGDKILNKRDMHMVRIVSVQFPIARFESNGVEGRIQRCVFLSICLGIGPVSLTNPVH